MIPSGQKRPQNETQNQKNSRRETVELVRKTIAESRRAYALVNNRSEGNGPLTDLSPVVRPPFKFLHADTLSGATVRVSGAGGRYLRARRPKRDGRCSGMINHLYARFDGGR